MKLSVKSGRYVIAVSGGVDSVVLLDMLSKTANIDLIVAHFDHGIRPESAKDRKFVENLAKNYGLEFFYNREELGSDASEELARSKRYDFLNQVVKENNAKGIITAHHKDDVIETAVFNLLRGTKRRGLSSLQSGKIIRPLLSLTKDEIIKYAQKNSLTWVEDSTNQDLKYSRNKIRKQLSKSSVAKKHDFHKTIANVSEVNNQIDKQLKSMLSSMLNQEKQLQRNKFIALDYLISTELVAYWLRKNQCQFDKKLISKLVIDLKTLKPGAKTDIDKKHYFEIKDKNICIIDR